MSKPVAGTQSLARAVDVLQLVADASEPPTLAALQAQTDLTRATLHRLLSSLTQLGLLEHGTDKAYRPGMRLVTLARKALSESDIRRLARGALVELRDITGETVHLAVPFENGMAYIDKIESSQVVRMNSTIGTIVAFHSTAVGKAFLSKLPEDKARALIDAHPKAQFTEFTSTETADILSKVRTARDEGYVFDDQENEVGISCFGAAIQDEDGQPIAAISISVPLFRLRTDHEFYAEPLRRAVRVLSAQGGFAA